MSKIRVLNLRDEPQYLGELMSLVAEIFPKGALLSEDYSPNNEFPLLLDEENFERVYFLLEDDMVVATTSYRPFEVDNPQNAKPLKIAAIGLIVTDPAFRKRGYASELLFHVMTEARNENCIMATLWSSMQNFYESLGFSLGGQEHQWTIKGPAEKDPKSDQIFQVKNLSAIAPIYEKNKFGPRRNWIDYQKLVEVEECRIFADSLEVPTAYAAIGKGRDLRGVVHEIGGDPKRIPQLLNFCLAQSGQDSIRLHYPVGGPNEKDLLKLFDSPPAQSSAFYQILDFAEVATWTSQAKTFPKGIEFKKLNEGFSVLSKGKEIFTTNVLGHFIQLFFGTFPMSQMEGLDPELVKIFTKFENLNPYFWGFDSV